MFGKSESLILSLQASNAEFVLEVCENRKTVESLENALDVRSHIGRESVRSLQNEIIKLMQVFFATYYF